MEKAKNITIIFLSLVVIILMFFIIYIKNYRCNCDKLNKQLECANKFDESIFKGKEEILLSLTNKSYNSIGTIKVNNFNKIIEKAKFIDDNKEEKNEEFDLGVLVKGNEIKVVTENNFYIINSISNPKAVKISALSNSDNYPIELYVLTSDKKIYNVLIEEDNIATINEYKIGNVVSFANNIEELDDTEWWRNFIIIKTEDGKYYTDYQFENKNYDSISSIELVEIN